jgi:hypothetical protein
MAIHLPEHPFDIRDNDCYLHVVQQYERDSITKWRVDELLDLFGPAAFDECLAHIFERSVGVTAKDEFVSLSFAVPGTLQATVLTMIKNGKVLTFRELLTKLIPYKVSSNQLKHLLAYLMDIGKIQVFQLAGSAIPCIALDIPEDEPGNVQALVNRLFLLADKISSQLTADETEKETQEVDSY